MDAPSDAHERTFALADLALQQIRALKQPALPRNYEIWYRYATGYYPELNRAINQMLAQKPELSDADIDDIYASHLSPSRVTTRIDSVGSLMVEQIKQVLDTVD